MLITRLHPKVESNNILQANRAFAVWNLVSEGSLLFTSDAADDTPCVDLGGRRNIKRK